MSQMLEAALAYAGRGYAVFPCRPRGKEPMTSRGFKDASRDARVISGFWQGAPFANVAVACGASGINVLDIDTKHGADPKEVAEELGLVGGTIVWTGEAPERSEEYPRSLSGDRGAHIFFRGDRRTAQTSIAGVELRGAGAYVVVPPSAHPSGVPYLGELPAANELSALPPSIADLLESGRTATPNPVNVWLSIVRDGVRAGSRNHQLTRLIGHLLRRGIDVDVAAELLHLVNSQRCHPPLSASEVDRIVESICAAELRRRRVLN